jgi:hypothetical protein
MNHQFRAQPEMPVEQHARRPGSGQALILEAPHDLCSARYLLAAE